MLIHADLGLGYFLRFFLLRSIYCVILNAAPRVLQYLLQNRPKNLTLIVFLLVAHTSTNYFWGGNSFVSV